jgi:hypothetical protein
MFFFYFILYIYIFFGFFTYQKKKRFMWFDNVSMCTIECGYILLFNDLGLQHNLLFLFWVKST